MNNEKLETLTLEEFNKMSIEDKRKVAEFYLSDDCTVDLDESNPDLHEAIMWTDFEAFDEANGSKVKPSVSVLYEI